MKKRNLAITAFVLCATLVMAIGFAALSGSLTIGGTATFNGDAISSEILESIKFSAATDDGVYTNATFTDTAATMTVNFYDLADDATIEAHDVLTATATFTIKYDTTNTSLPAVSFSVPTPTITGEGFNVTVDWTEAQTLMANQSKTITVTVTYTVPEEVPTGAVSGTISIPLPFATIA